MSHMTPRNIFGKFKQSLLILSSVDFDFVRGKFSLFDIDTSVEDSFSLTSVLNSIKKKATTVLQRLQAINTENEIQAKLMTNVVITSIQLKFLRDVEYFDESMDGILRESCNVDFRDLYRDLCSIVLNLECLIDQSPEFKSK